MARQQTVHPCSHPSISKKMLTISGTTLLTSADTGIVYAMSSMRAFNLLHKTSLMTHETATITDNYFTCLPALLTKLWSMLHVLLCTDCTAYRMSRRPSYFNEFNATLMLPFYPAHNTMTNRLSSHIKRVRSTHIQSLIH